LADGGIGELHHGARSRLRSPIIEGPGTRAGLSAALTLWIAVGLLAAGADAKPPKPKPKPPELTLLTETEQGALRREAIKLAVESRRGSETRVTARFVVDGYPEDFPFRLGPETRKLKDDRAIVNLGLSPRMREVLDFAIKSCRGATLAIEAKVGRRTGHLDAGLRRPREC
jgi:hypothetical protein